MNPIEIAGFVTGALSVWLAVRQSPWNWPFGVANAVFFLILFWRARLYGDMALQVLFIAICLLGWYRWLFGGAGQSRLRVTRITMVGALGVHGGRRGRDRGLRALSAQRGGCIAVSRCADNRPERRSAVSDDAQGHRALAGVDGCRRDLHLALRRAEPVSHQPSLRRVLRDVRRRVARLAA